MVHAAPRRPRRDRHQDRTARDRRRHARLGAALPQGRGGERDQRGRVLPLVQSRQAFGRRRFHAARRAADRAGSRAAVRRLRRKPEGWRPRQVRARLRQPLRVESTARLRVDHGIRSGWSVRRSRRLRLHHPGHVRIHERHRRARRSPGGWTAEGRCRDHRSHDGNVRDGRDPGGALAPRSHRRRAVGGFEPVRCVGRDDVGNEFQLSHHRQGTWTRRQCAPQHSPLPGVRVHGRPRDRRRRQRRPVCEVLRPRQGSPNGRPMRATRRTPTAYATATRSFRSSPA